MTLPEFKQRVRDAFGARMEFATPANIREFLDTLARDRWREERAALAVELNTLNPPLLLPPGDPASYDEILRGFFAETLGAPAEEGVIELWLFALELAYAALEEQIGQEIGGLFAEEEPHDHP